MRHRDAIQLYMLGGASVVISVASLAVTAMSWLSTERQALAAERTVQLETAKNLPDFRLSDVRTVNGFYEIDVELVDGIARNVSFDLVSKIDFAAAIDDDKSVRCSSEWLFWRLRDRNHSIKSGKLATLVLDQASVTKDFQKSLLSAQGLGEENANFRSISSSLSEHSMALIEYTNILNTPSILMLSGTVHAMKHETDAEDRWRYLRETAKAATGPAKFCVDLHKQLQR